MTSSAGQAIRDEVMTLKRTRIIDAAVDLFFKNGYDNTTLEAVAESLGVTKPFIYAHFSSKAELLGEICSRGVTASLRAIDSALTKKTSNVRKLEQFVLSFATSILENRMYIAIYTRDEKGLLPADADRINSMRREFDRKLTALLASGTKAGEFTVRDPNITALAIGGMVSWAYAWFRPDGRLTIVETAIEMKDLILAMVGAAPR